MTNIGIFFSGVVPLLTDLQVLAVLDLFPDGQCHDMIDLLTVIGQGQTNEFLFERFLGAEML